MGSACCVAARDRTITTGSNNDVMPRNVRYSPSWSVRWDNRRRVAGEEASINWFSDGVGVNNGRVETKSQTTGGVTAYASEEGSPLESFRNLTWQKSSPSEGYIVPQSDQSVAKNPSEAKGSKESQLSSEQSPPKTSPSTHSISSFSTSPLTSSQSQLLAEPKYPARGSPRQHLHRQLSHTRIPSTKSPNFSISEEGSPFMLPSWSNESNRGSHASSDNWSVPLNENYSFDSEFNNFNRENKLKNPTIDIQTCGACCKLLTEKSHFGTQKIITNNELAVVAILICGHVYHAECLENMTSEINKYDPVCPVCTLGEKQVFKLSEKALKADVELKAKLNNKKSRSRVVDDDMYDDMYDDVMYDHHHYHKYEGRVPKMTSSSSVKTSGGKPFLKRHFSFGSSKGSRSYSENNHSRKKGFFWAKSSKE